MAKAQKTQFVGGYVLPEEEAALLAMAERERLNRSETLRWLIRRTAESLGLWPPVDQPHQYAGDHLENDRHPVPS